MSRADAIRQTLARATEHDGMARAMRKQAGQLLAQARVEQPNGSAWFRAAGLDERTARLLLELAAEGQEAQP